MTSGPSCFVVGAGLVPRQCLDLLSNSGFEIRGIFSSDGSLAELCRARDWRHAASLDDFRAALSDQPFDFLFSINNSWLIPEEVARRARRAAINYHDSPLPRYAGLNATSWALFAGEREHAVTWHEVTATIDSGRIYKQRAVPIDADDTAFALNAKCVEAAVASFAELVAELAAETEHPIPQPAAAAGKSYFGQRDRPPVAATLRFDRPAEEIRNLVRALDFGPARNPLGLPKVLVRRASASDRAESELLVVSSAAVDPERSTRPPGSVVGIDRGLRVATSTFDVSLFGLRTLAGTAVAAEALASRGAFSVGSVLPVLTETLGAEISAYDRRIAPHEPRLVARLVDRRPWRHPYAGAAGRAAEPIRTSVAELAAGVEEMLVIFAAYVARLSGGQPLDVGLQAAAQRSPDSRYFSPVVPLRISAPAGSDIDAFRRMLGDELARCAKQGSYALDAWLRHPDLRGAVEPSFPVALASAASPEALDPAALGADLVLAAYEDGSPPEIIHQGALDAWQVEAVGRQLASVARSLQKAAGSELADLFLLDEAEHTRIVFGWNDTKAPYPGDLPVHRLISLQAARAPDARAVRFAGLSISYGELEKRSDRLARRLKAKGVGRGDLVILCLPRSVDVVVGLIGILKSGAAYVPIDPAYPASRVTAIATDSQARVAVCWRAQRESVLGSIPEAVCLDAPEPGEADQALEPEPSSEVPVSALDRAYVIYTSGSTGVPKGVAVAHRSLINHAWAMANNFGLGCGDRILLSASIGFDIAGEQIYPALFRGAEVVVRPEDLFESFTRFGRFVREEALTALILPTAFWHEWIRHLDRSAEGVSPSLRFLATGTEEVLGEYLIAWQRITGGRVKFLQGYGPTETTVTCTVYLPDPSKLETIDPRRPVPIGRPLPNTCAYILDHRLRPVPVGIPGELCIGGDGVALGYHRLPELTSERFVADPFRPGQRLYRTGDRARFEPDGQIIFMGRTDLQIKLRGYRIELGEIEAVARAYPRVSEAAVLLREDRPGRPFLCAYVTTEPGGIDAEALRSFIAQRLPAAMVPAAIVTLEAFPLTLNAKIDRRALPAPIDRTASDPDDGSSLERGLAHLWREVLGQDRARVEDDFFALGGDSLRAVAMLSAVEKRHQVAIALSTFVRAPTIAALAARIEAASDSGHRPEESQVISIQEGDGAAGPPLWLIHPIGGHVIFGNRLSAHVDPRQTVLGIESGGLDGKTKPLEDLEEMAAHYTRLIRARQPRGPYLLAGSSMGGLIAVEIGRRLLDEGADVPLVALLDAYGPDYPRRTSRVVRILDNLRELVTKPQVPVVMKKVRRIATRLIGRSDALEKARSYDVMSVIEGEGALVDAIIAVVLANERAMAGHRPRLYPGPLVLLRATKNIFDWPGFRFDDPFNGWAPLAGGGLRWIPIEATHENMLDEPQIAQLGRSIQALIDEVRAAATAAHRLAA